MSISTGGGDGGTTQVGRRRLSKGSLEVEVLGALDELVSALGFARSLTANEAVRDRAERLQRVLFTVSAGIGASVTPGSDASVEGRSGAGALPEGLVAELEEEIHELENREGMLSDWALPGGHAGAAAFDLARVACRRAERLLVRLREETGYRAPDSLVLLNRMSDLLWLHGRVLEQEAGVSGALRS